MGSGFIDMRATFHITHMNRLLVILKHRNRVKVRILHCPILQFEIKTALLSFVSEVREPSIAGNTALCYMH